MSKVALITGGAGIASGIGLATGQSLASKGWKIVIVDINPAGEKAAQDLGGVFHKTNVGDYDDLAQTFAKVWKEFGRLDFVFANAGIVEKAEFYKRYDSALPAPLDMTILDINLKSVIATSYLALHFFRKNKISGGSLIITSSCGGVYPIGYLPMYASAKHGCVGLTRSLAQTAYQAGIRVNCICPGSVSTGLLKQEEWEDFGKAEFTPIGKVVEAVEAFLEDETLYGMTAELIQDRRYFRPPPEHWDPVMKRVIERTQALSKI
ncbi:hypothetical protein FE257_011678 [Aspergillus nanangensis]|uniref:Uncharacterized protein n=1 Tax=Aspergillus nanangensis TaxID=2582783 RepID=A0AAD4GZ31_ASPNN|nr:hypothetical protein FE257_011678 [Aspergillus nanangensis]